MALNVASIFARITVEGTAEAVRGVESVQRGFTDSATAARNAGAQYDRTSAALGSVGQRATMASRSTAQFRAAQLSALAATERYNAVLADEDASVRQLATAEAALIRANERVRATMPTAAIGSAGKAADEAGGRFSRLFGSLGSSLKTLGELGVAFGAFELARKAIDITKEAAAYQRSIVQIRAMTGATTSEIKTMSSALLGLSGRVAQSPDDLATSLYHMEAIGLRGAAALNGVKVAAMGAKIGNADLEDTTNALTATIASGIGKNQSFSKTMSQLLTIVGTGDMKLQQFNESLSSGLLSVMATAGVSLKDVGAALATFGDNNIRGAHAATMLRVAVQAMQQPMKSGAADLDAIGIHAGDLEVALQKGGLNAAITLLKTRLDRAGDSGKKAGAVLVDAFGKRANTGISVLINQYDRLQSKYGMLDRGAQTFGQRWSEITKTASFQFEALGSEAEAAGIQLAGKLTPALGVVASLLASGVRNGLKVAQSALHPFAVAWGVVADGAGHAAPVLRDIGGVLSSMAPVLKGAGAAALSMWVAFKGYQIARTAVFAIMDIFSRLGPTVRNQAAEFQVFTGSLSRSTEVAEAEAAQMAAVIKSEFAQIEAAALQAAAAQDRAAALEAQAFSDQTAASSASTDAQVADADERAAAAWAAARASAAAAATTSAAAEEASAAIVTSGDAARIGWAGLAGPLGLALIGVTAIVSMFHKSSSASQEATDAVKAYSDALSGSTGSSGTTIVDAVMKQLSNNGLPDLLASLNKELGSTQYSGAQFVTAIQKAATGTSGPLDELRSRLQSVIKAGTGTQAISTQSGFGQVTQIVKTMTPAAQNASKALAMLNTQYSSLTKAAREELRNAKTYGVAASSIDKVASSTQVASSTAKQYAAMLGLVADQNGIVNAGSKVVAAAINTVKSAYDHATQSGDAFLAALQTFSGSAGTAADRAAIIGATLKAANGEALNFSTQMNNAAVASHQFAVDVRTAAGAADAAKKARAAYNKEAGKSATTAQADAHAQAAAAKAIKDYASRLIDLKTGTINYRKAGAAPLLSDLNSMQTAAMNAAEAEYQHAKAMGNGKDAADAAYKVYKNQTQGALIDEAKKLGLTAGQAKRLADQYFGMPKNVKTMIEQEGANPVVKVLNAIGKQLSYLTGHAWTPILAVKDNASGKIRAVKSDLQGLKDKTVVVNEKTKYTYVTPGQSARSHDSKPSALGTRSAFGSATIPPNTAFTVGERGWEGGVTDSHGRASIFPAVQAMAMGFRKPTGYAGGTGGGAGGSSGGGDLGGGSTPSISTLGTGKNEQWVFRGTKYASLTAAQNALNSWERSHKSSVISAAQSALSGITKSGSSFSWSQFQQQIVDAMKAINRASVAGASQKTLDKMDKHLENIEKQGARAEKRLGHQALNQANALGRQVANLTNPASASSVLGSIKSLESTLKQAGLPKKFIQGLANENHAIADLVKARNAAAAAVTAAQSRYASAKQSENQDMASWRQATAGGFDITSAGQNSNGKVTAGSLLAAQTQDVTRTRAWVKGIDKLAALKIFPASYLRQLVGAGPSSLSTVQALLSMNHGELSRFAANQRTIAGLGRNVALNAANRLDAPRLQRLDKIEQRASARELKAQANLERAVNHLGDRLEHKLDHLDLNAGLDMKAHQLWVWLTTGENHHKKVVRGSK